MKINIYPRFLVLAIIIISGILNVSAQREAEFIKLQKEFILKPSGETEARYIKELKILTHRALNNIYGETFIVYDPRYQEIKFHKAFTRQVDGTIMEVPANAYNEVLPSAAANAPAYNYLKEMIVTHTGLELGATIYLDYSVITKAGYHNYLDITESLQELSPIKEYAITVKVPTGTPVNSTVTGFADTKRETKSENQDIYSWSFRNIPANSREAYQPIAAGFTPYFVLNTYDSQDKAFSFINYSQKAPSSVIEKFSRISAGNSPDKYIDVVRNYIFDEMDYNRLSVWECGRTIRSLQDVCNTGYGTALEKAVLVRSLLDNAGIPSELAILYSKGLSGNIYGLTSIKETGIITNYNNAKVFIPLSINRILTLNELGNCYDVYSITNNKKVDIQGGSEAVITQQTDDIVISTDSVKIKGNNQVSGILRGKLLNRLEPEYNRSVGISWNQYGYYKLELPENIAGINDFGLNKLLSQRISHFELPYIIDDKVVHQIVLSQGIECKTLPQDINITNKAGQLSISLTNEGNKITVRKEIKLNKNLYSPVEYKDFKELVQGWYNPNINTLLLYKGR